MMKNKHGKMSIENKGNFLDHFSYSFVSMTTPCTVQIYDGSKENADKCFHAVNEHTLALEKKYNFFNSESYLNRVINNRIDNVVKIDKQTYDVLKIVRQLSIQTNELFDITMGTLKQCYKRKSIKEVNQCVSELSGVTGLHSWNLEDGCIVFKRPETLIDLGGVIKEFAVDEGARIVREHGIESAIVNFGGDMHTVGRKSRDQDFMVAIKNPKDPVNKLVTIKLRNQALTTSASYERNTKIEGKDFSHILSHGIQQDDGIISATVISDSTLKSGIYSTSFMINTNIEIPDDVKVVLIDKDLKLHQNLQ